MERPTNASLEMVPWCTNEARDLGLASFFLLEGIVARLVCSILPVDSVGEVLVDIRALIFKDSQSNTCWITKRVAGSVGTETPPEVQEVSYCGNICGNKLRRSPVLSGDHRALRGGKSKS